MAKIALIGASGFVGTAVLKEALSRGHQVKAIVRNPENIVIKDDNLEVVQADVQHEAEVTEAVTGADAVVSSYNPGWANPNIYADTLKGYRSIIDGTKKAGINRIIIVGGAGSLFAQPGVRVMDTGVIPESILPGVKGLAEVLFNYLQPETELNWTFFSPAGTIAPGERTGKFRLGKDELIVDEKGESKISVEDYAIALIDELESPQHLRERFTIGY